MQVNVKNGLTGRCITVHRDPVARIVKLFFFSYLLCGDKQFADISRIGIGYVVDGRNVPARNDKDMRWRLWVDVAKRQHIISLIYDLSINVAVGNLAEKTV